MKKKSFVRNIMIYMAVLMTVLSLVLVVYTVMSFQTMRREVLSYSESLLDIYGKDLEYRISGMDTMLKNMIYQNNNLELLKSRDESVRYFASIELKKSMKELLKYDNSVDMLIVADGAYDIVLNYENTSVSYQDSNSIRAYVHAFLEQDYHLARWQFAVIGEEDYLCKLYLYNERVIGLFTRKSNLMRDTFADEGISRTFAIVDSDGLIRAYTGELAENAVYLADIATEYSYVSEKTLAEGDLTLVCLTEKISIFGQVRSGMLILLVMLLLSFLSGILIAWFTRREILYPMKDMTAGMKLIGKGDYEHRITGQYDNEEFELLKDTFNQLMDEIIGLKIRNYEKLIALKDTQLRCIRLQLKPHFFLNALTTISSLSSRSENRQIQIYIDTLCKNIRYMFRSGFHTVPIVEEILHVENYFEMQELKYPDCVFHYINLPEELEQWKIPQMLIHTFVENIFKYAVDVDAVLTVLISVKLTEHAGEEMLLLTIEDDGPGYPAEVLAYLKSDREEASQDASQDAAEEGYRTGLRSMKRMMALMYDREDLFHVENIFYENNRIPHGCLNKLYIPRAARNEL